MGGRVWGVGGGQGRCERRREVLVNIQKIWVGSGWGVRVDVNEKLKFL